MQGGDRLRPRRPARRTGSCPCSRGRSPRLRAPGRPVSDCPASCPPSAPQWRGKATPPSPSGEILHLAGRGLPGRACGRQDAPAYCLVDPERDVASRGRRLACSPARSRSFSASCSASSSRILAGHGNHLRDAGSSLSGTSARKSLTACLPAPICSAESNEVSRLTLFEGAPIAVFDGRPHRLADDEAEGALRRPDCAQAWRRARGRQGQALRARLRASLTAPARDASSALARPGRGNGRPAEQGNRPTRAPGSAQHGAIRSRSSAGFRRADEGGLLRSQAFPFPFPRAVERRGTGTGNGAPIRGSRAGSRRRS